MTGRSRDEHFVDQTQVLRLPDIYYTDITERIIGKGKYGEISSRFCGYIG